jgi:hypothetical protein
MALIWQQEKQSRPDDYPPLGWGWRGNQTASTSIARMPAAMFIYAIAPFDNDLKVG